MIDSWLGVSVTDGHGVCETFAYDDYGRPLKHRHADGNSTEWQRDRLGRVTRYATPGQSVMRISYDAYDLPIEVTSGNEVWTMEYTPIPSLTGKIIFHKFLGYFV